MLNETHIHVHVHIDGTILSDILKGVNINTHKLNQLIMTDAELLDKLTAANTKADKIIAEIQKLKDTVNTTPDVPQNIVDAVNTLSDKLQAADDLNADEETV